MTEDDERLLVNDKTPVFLASGGDEYQSGARDEAGSLRAFV